MRDHFWRSLCRQLTTVLESFRFPSAIPTNLSAMVCDKCTKKLSKLATVHKNTSAGPSALAGLSSKKVTNENKLLSSKQKFKPDVNQYKKCRICKQLTHHVASHYCQSCAYHKGICAMCGIKIIETKNYRQTGV